MKYRAVLFDLDDTLLKTSTIKWAHHKAVAKRFYNIDLTDEFFLLQGSDDEPAHKPDPRVFDRALELLKSKNISRTQVMYVGDALMDYYAARDAGIGFMGIATGFVSQEQFGTEDAEAVRSLAALLNALQRKTVVQPRSAASKL
jgi:phosphoglycolate phosphatase-like HAD superfamily hydrolase